MRHEQGWRLRAAAFGLALAVALGAGYAGARPLAQVRVSSLQAALADTTTVAAAAGQPVPGEDLLLGLLAPFGLGDLSLLDATRPLVAVLPLEGMMMPQRGVVVALPVTGAAPLLDALAGNFTSRERDGDLEVFSDASGPGLYARVQDGYVVAGRIRQFVVGFDLTVLRTPMDGPPGSAVAELDLEPLTPLLQASLVGAREGLRQQVVRGLSEPQARPLGEPPVDAAALAGMMDLYLDAAQGMLMDLSRVQLGLQVQGEHLFWHNRVVPRPGTATAEFVAKQGGGLPPLSRVVDPGAVSFAGQMKITPRLRDATAVFLGRYMELAGRLLPAPQGEAGENGTDGAAQGGTLSFFSDLGTLLEQSLDCYTGEIAGVVGFSTPGGMEVSEAVGSVDSPECRDLTRRSLSMMGSFPEIEGVPVPPISSAQESIRGVVADRFEVDMGAAFGELDADGKRLLELLYGGPTLTSYVATAGPLTYYALGANARSGLAKMLDAAGDSARAGITSATFVPLAPGPGLFFGVEVPRLLAFARDSMPEDDPERAQLDQVAQVFQGSEASGRVAGGLVFDPGGATFQLALPLRALEAGRLAQSLSAEPAPAAGAEPTPATGAEQSPTSTE